MSRQCKTCQLEWPITSFHKNGIYYMRECRCCLAIRRKSKRLAANSSKFTMKQCAKCNLVKPTDQFHKGEGNKSCKSCRREYYYARMDKLQRERKPITEIQCRACEKIKPISMYKHCLMNISGYKTVCITCNP